MHTREPAEIGKQIVLVGGGHAHVTVLRSFGMRPEPGTRIVLVAKELDAPYSGMLPGFVAGHYSLDECHIDLVRLARFAGARLIHGEAIGVDREKRELVLPDRPPLAYDLLSLDTGITPLLDEIEGARRHAIAVKPVSTFAPRWQALEASALQPAGPRRFTVVGTGAAGFELALAIARRLRSEAPRRGLDASAFEVRLVGSGPLLPSHNSRARRYAVDALSRRSITLIENDAVVSIDATTVHLASGAALASDATLLTTKAAAPAWFRASGLDVDKDGFLAVRPTLQMLGDDAIFAVGDCASVLAHPREKAGVFAVRQGPPLADNLRRVLRGQPARPFVPQRKFLTLLSLGDGSAIAARGPWAAAGRWAWHWKDRIDRLFMDRFNILPDMSAGDTEMFCRGCAAKVGPATLSAALDRLPQPPAGIAVRNELPRDDAALVVADGEPPSLETIDFMPAFWPDPHLLGEIAAAHALSDIYAKGGEPRHAQAIAVLPRMARHLQADDLHQLLAGARKTFDVAGVALVGGHTSTGDEMSIGFSVSGRLLGGVVRPKRATFGGMRLVLTKPLGVGVLLAAWMRGLARAREIRGLLDGMRISNGPGARILAAHGAVAMTDVTGFGLAGHLTEMLGDSGLGAHVELAALPLYPGVSRCLEAGIRSTLVEDNLAFTRHVSGESWSDGAVQALLLDPQTSGGLLAAVPMATLGDCLAALEKAGIVAADIGSVDASAPQGPGGVVISGRLPSRTT